MDLPSYGVADAARAAVAAVIRLSHDRHLAGKKTVVAGRAAVEKRRIYSATDLVAADRARVAAEVAARKPRKPKTRRRRPRSYRWRATRSSRSGNACWLRAVCARHVSIVAASYGQCVVLVNSVFV